MKEKIGLAQKIRIDDLPQKPISVTVNKETSSPLRIKRISYRPELMLCRATFGYEGFTITPEYDYGQGTIYFSVDNPRFPEIKVNYSITPETDGDPKNEPIVQIQYGVYSPKYLAGISKALSDMMKIVNMMDQMAKILFVFAKDPESISK